MTDKKLQKIFYKKRVTVHGIKNSKKRHSVVCNPLQGVEPYSDFLGLPTEVEVKNALSLKFVTHIIQRLNLAVIPGLTNIQKICESPDTSPFVLPTSAFFYQK